MDGEEGGAYGRVTSGRIFWQRFRFFVRTLKDRFPIYGFDVHLTNNNLSETLVVISGHAASTCLPPILPKHSQIISRRENGLSRTADALPIIDLGR